MSRIYIKCNINRRCLINMRLCLNFYLICIKSTGGSTSKSHASSIKLQPVTITKDHVYPSTTTIFRIFSSVNHGGVCQIIIRHVSWLETNDSIRSGIRVYRIELCLKCSNRSIYHWYFEDHIHVENLERFL